MKSNRIHTRTHFYLLYHCTDPDVGYIRTKAGPGSWIDTLYMRWEWNCIYQTLLYCKLKQLIKTLFNQILHICRWRGDNYCRIKLRTNPRDSSFMNFEQREQRITHVRLNLGSGFSWIPEVFHALLVSAPAVNIWFWCARSALLYYCIISQMNPFGAQNGSCRGGDNALIKFALIVSEGLWR
jgi:hypothetical protein